MLNSKLLNHPSLLYANEISAICSPLKNLSISYFSHVRIDKEKNFSALSTHADFTEHYLKNRYYTTDIHMIDGQQFGDFFIWDMVEYGHSKLCEEAGQFGIHNPFTIIDRHSEGIDYYHFANNSMNKKINEVYLANLDLLKLYISYFKDHAADLLKKSRALAFNLQPSSLLSKENSVICDRESFLEHINHSKETNSSFTNVSLSKRQIEVLNFVIRGRTFKEIARLLNLSPRTVGHYFETIKDKFSVDSRSQLISKYMDSKNNFPIVIKNN